MEEESKVTEPVPTKESGAKEPKQSTEKEGKIIIRNLGFDLREKHLKSLFDKFGEIVGVNVPLNNTNN